jgi:hypothetical protein
VTVTFFERSLFGSPESEARYTKTFFAFGATEEDIHHAFATAHYDGLVEDGNNKYLLIGFDTKANPKENRHFPKPLRPGIIGPG